MGKKRVHDGRRSEREGFGEEGSRRLEQEGSLGRDRGNEEIRYGA